jgi:hypothetical protein
LEGLFIHIRFARPLTKFPGDKVWKKNYLAHANFLFPDLISHRQYAFRVAAVCEGNGTAMPWVRLKAAPAGRGLSWLASLRSIVSAARALPTSRIWYVCLSVIVGTYEFSSSFWTNNSGDQDFEGIENVKGAESLLAFEQTIWWVAGQGIDAKVYCEHSHGLLAS